MPESIFISEVFPLPFSPRSESISPLFTVILTWSLATTEPNLLVTFLNSIAASAIYASGIYIHASGCKKTTCIIVTVQNLSVLPVTAARN
jgi:hypothetical protein